MFALPVQQRRHADINPDALVSSEWLSEHHDDPQVKIIEMSPLSRSYLAGHIPGAHCIDRAKGLQEETVRDIISKDNFESIGSPARPTTRTTTRRTTRPPITSRYDQPTFM